MAGTADPVQRTLEIEDATNLYAIHPISGRLVPLCARLGIPPNAVSVAGMGCGVLAGVAYAHYRDRWAVLGGFALMLAWHVLDGADGQLARLTNAQSQSGKILDGICDYVTFTAVYIGLVLVLGRQHGAWVWGLVALSGICHAVQSAIYEVQRQEYNHWGHGRPSAALPERALPARPGPGDWLHAAYLFVQLRSVGLTGAPRRQLEAALRDPDRAAPRPGRRDRGPVAPPRSGGSTVKRSRRQCAAGRCCPPTTARSRCSSAPCWDSRCFTSGSRSWR